MEGGIMKQFLSEYPRKFTKIRSIKHPIRIFSVLSDDVMNNRYNSDENSTNSTFLIKENFG